MGRYQYRYVCIRLIFCMILFGCNSENDSITKEPPPPKATTVPLPEAMYIQNGCISCHGPEGNGRGTRTHLLRETRIPNFQDRTTYLNGSSKESIANSIKNGIPGTYMKAYSHMRKNEIDALAEYILKMQKNNR
ncbi:cytochrome C [Leptospira ellinghausenii]|uniref:Cytochrome C n=1 Tax=Leptospira ellinghausenii TaxID=1917822 RepID=A0A2P2DGN9_9LEPT|nr:cytochrome c [Leptospira ellinghausenii]GBF43793.1 cytochrome C [Leptospira ellinghausenii]